MIMNRYDNTGSKKVLSIGMADTREAPYDLGLARCTMRFTVTNGQLVVGEKSYHQLSDTLVFQEGDKIKFTAPVDASFVIRYGEIGG